MGDFFDQWIRDSIDIPKHQKVIDKLRLATQQGLTIYLQTGNRDFMYGDAFKKATGIHYIKDKHWLKLENTKVLLMHGDTLCTDDLTYQRIRKILRNPVSKWLFRIIPDSWLLGFTKKLRQRSTTHKASKSTAIMDVNLDTVNTAMQDCDLLIHGHTHRPQVHQYGDKSRYVLGDWEHNCQIIRYHQNHFQLSPYKEGSTLT